MLGRWKSWMVLASLLAIGSVAAGCGGGDGTVDQGPRDQGEDSGSDGSVPDGGGDAGTVDVLACQRADIFISAIDMGAGTVTFTNPTASDIVLEDGTYQFCQGPGKYGAPPSGTVPAGGSLEVSVPSIITLNPVSGSLGLYANTSYASRAAMIHYVCWGDGGGTPRIDIARQAIPVVPAAHYTCGGVVTDLSGRSDLPGLYAVGEATYTGLHGANRLASNSLLECAVIGRTCATAILQSERAAVPAVPPWDESLVESADEQVVISHNWDELRLLMWNYVGIVRTTKRLERALHRIKLLKTEIDDYYANFRVNRDLLELRNLVDCAELIVRSALMRHESRGLHYSRDFPNTLPVSFPTVLVRRARSGAKPKVYGLSG